MGGGGGKGGGPTKRVSCRSSRAKMMSFVGERHVMRGRVVKWCGGGDAVLAVCWQDSGSGIIEAAGW